MFEREFSTADGADVSNVSDFRFCGCAACQGKSYESGIAVDLSGYFDSAGPGTISATAELATHAETTVAGSLSGSEAYDLIAVNLVAGQTYTFAYRGTVEGGVDDPYLALFNPTLTTVIAQDDDGGLGRSSQITYTAASSGTYYLYATSWYHVDPSAPGYPTYRDSGDYTIDVWSPDPAHDAPGTLAGAVAIDVGTTFAYLDSAADLDMYKIEATEGMVYTVTYAGGVSGAGDRNGEPGENIGRLRVYDADGNEIATAVNYETGISFFAETGGTYYVRAESFDGTFGGYTLDVAEINPADHDPLDAFIWDDAANIVPGDDGVVKVYFATPGESFGELADNGTDPLLSLGWNPFEKQQIMQAFGEYTKILGFTYVETTDASEADFRLITTESEQYGAYFYPQDPGYGDAQGIGAFNVLSGGWNFDEQQSLLQGGFAFAVVLHEFGHAHGLAHPHDGGGGSDVMLGVSASQGSYGIYDLNQGVYTVMSYNDAWDTGPNGPTPYTGANIDSGWSGTLSAFDIAALQERYGIINEHATGDDVYQLGDANDPGVYYETIWDTGGTDEIRYSGERDTQIDLLAATIDYTPTGGGVVSFVDGIWGGYTIARGVVIENASGGSGDDILLGNSAANVLTGNQGEDRLLGREGDDALIGGNGNDTLEGGDGEDNLHGGNGNDVVNGGAGDDMLTGGNGNDVFAFTDLGGADAITDFFRGESKPGGKNKNDGQDKIDLSGLDAVSGGGDDAFSWVGASAFSNTAGELRSYSQGGSHYLAGDVDGDGVADFTIQTNVLIISADLVF